MQVLCRCFAHGDKERKHILKIHDNKLAIMSYLFMFCSSKTEKFSRPIAFMHKNMYSLCHTTKVAVLDLYAIDESWQLSSTACIITNYCMIFHNSRDARIVQCIHFKTEWVHVLRCVGITLCVESGKRVNSCKF